MSPPEPLAIPLEEAVAVLTRIAASDQATIDDRALHLRVVRALDLLSRRGLVVPAERFAPLVANERAPETSLLDLFVELLTESEGTIVAVIARAQAHAAAAAPNVPSEAAAAHAARVVLIDPARTIGAYLPRAVALSNEFRREELVRAWAAAIGAPIRARDKLEKPERSKKALDKLDYRRIRADEERLAVERSVLAEQAEKVREKQRKRDAEALASAQRE